MDKRERQTTRNKRSCPVLCKEYGDRQHCIYGGELREKRILVFAKWSWHKFIPASLLGSNSLAAVAGSARGR